MRSLIFEKLEKKSINEQQPIFGKYPIWRKLNFFLIGEKSIFEQKPILEEKITNFGENLNLN